MAAELVPIRLSVTAGDLYTLWAPRWRDAGDEWEGYLGKDEDIYAFDRPTRFIKPSMTPSATNAPGAC